ncbi:Ca-activated chloride channel family protein [Oceanobacillus limi]|uniref:Ca-activated chloride channel family protein n=1 Tax=Oceanobacillus limi TaxID=930131 RepID=A0A1I0DNB3_9BACI|nr:VWA domain-containing protein [Oceanobacillus limi]SET33832.1 Ca-activated chloride channel family protein [Oceanobacillus limi]
MEEVIKSHLPPIEEDVEEAYLDDWWKVYYSLVAEEYPDPRGIFEEKELEPFDHPALEDDRTNRMQEQINVLILLDVSGSMSNEINNRKMIDIAKDSILEFTADLPSSANVGLRVYGHKGSSKEKDKEISCSSSELVYDIQPFEKDEFKDALDPYEPSGWTPKARSLQRASEDFKNFPAENNANIIYVVSDGIETCDGDPVSVTKSLMNTEIQPLINVIGFNVDDDAQQKLLEIAEMGQGEYTSAVNEEDLQAVFDRAEEMIHQWEQWKQLAKEDIELHKSSQSNAADDFYNEWKEVNQRERRNVFGIINDLRSTGYITEESHSYFAIQRTKRTYNYTEIGEEAYSDLIKDINNNYQKNIQEIQKDLEEINQ